MQTSSLFFPLKLPSEGKLKVESSKYSGVSFLYDRKLKPFLFTYKINTVGHFRQKMKEITDFIAHITLIMPSVRSWDIQ